MKAAHSSSGTMSTCNTSTSEVDLVANNNDMNSFSEEDVESQRGSKEEATNEPQANVARTPEQTLEAVYKAGEHKAAQSLDALMTQSFMAGMYKSVACQLYLTLGGGFLGASVFATGLIAITLTSAELFTGDSLVFIASVLGRRVSIRSLLRNWTVSWIFNFCGCLVFASLLGYASGCLKDAGQVDYAVKYATKKADAPWVSIFIKGIGGNFLVCLGVWQASTAQSVASKILALWFPVQAFVNLGFEHSVANMYYIPVGMMYGADISIYRLLFQALLPATLGNIIGGGFFIGFVYWYVFDSMAADIHAVAGISRGIRRVDDYVKSSRHLSHHHDD